MTPPHDHEVTNAGLPLKAQQTKLMLFTMPTRIRTPRALFTGPPPDGNAHLNNRLAALLLIHLASQMVGGLDTAVQAKSPNLALRTFSAGGGGMRLSQREKQSGNLMKSAAGVRGVGG